MRSTSFKIGDRVVMVLPGFAGDAHLNIPGTVIGINIGDLRVKLDNEVIIRFEAKRFLPEEIYNSGVYQAMREENV